MNVTNLPAGCSCAVLHDLGEMDIYADDQDVIEYPNFLEYLKKIFDKSRDDYYDIEDDSNWLGNTAFFIAYTGSSQPVARENLKKLGFVTTRSSQHRKMEDTRHLDFRLHFIRSSELYENLEKELAKLESA